MSIPLTRSYNVRTESDVRRDTGLLKNIGSADLPGLGVRRERCNRSNLRVLAPANDGFQPGRDVPGPCSDRSAGGAVWGRWGMECGRCHRPMELAC
jgi:hypothetical protein